MIYRVHILLAFQAEGFAQGLFNHAQALIQHAHTVNPGQPNEEHSFIRFEHCFHDKAVQKPCELVDEQLTP